MTATARELYDSYYYAHGCGLPYNREEKHWSQFFAAIADRIVADFGPAVVLDAGCAMGFLVEALRERGAEAFGVDISEYAIANVAAAVRPFCRVRSITDPLPRKYELIVCIEVLEHLLPADSERAVANLCAHSDDILFSSSPDDYKEATHFNVQLPDYWAEQFARHGFHRDLEYNASYVTPWAIRFRRSRQPAPKVVRAYERRLWLLEREANGGRTLALEQRRQLADQEHQLRQLQAEVARLTAEAAERNALLQKMSQENAKAVQALIDELPVKQRLVRSLTEEKDRAVQALHGELSERDTRLQALGAELEAITCEAEALRAQCVRQIAAERAAHARQTEARQRECEAKVKNLEARLRQRQAEAATKERVIDSLTAELAGREQHLTALVREGEQVAHQLREELASVRCSRAWRLAVRLAGLRRRLLPRGSLRERGARLGYRAARVWKHEGCGALIYRSARKVKRTLLGGPAPGPGPAAPPTQPQAADAYALWIQQNEPSAADLERQRAATFALRPKISIAVPAYNTPAPFLVAMVESVLAQTYADWELCVADGGSTDPAVLQILEDYARRDSRVRCKRLPTNLGIAGNSNEAAALASGDFVALLDHDDTLAPFALHELVEAINRPPDSDFLYSDEDKINADGTRRSQPHFKPDWSPDTLRSHNYVCHLSCFRRDLWARLGGFRAGFDGSQDYDLILRATELARRVVHVPKVLYHWRMHEASCASAPEAKMYAYGSAKKAIRAHLERLGLAAEVRDGRTLGVYEVRYQLPRRPLVSVVIPNRDNHELLERCLASLARSTYDHYEVVIVENGSGDPRTFACYERAERSGKVRIVRWEGEFNYSGANNLGAARAEGDVLLFLNNDVEAINADWLERLLEYALRPDVGAVGAKLYYPNDTVQHGGVILGLGGIAGHPHVHWPRGDYGYFGRLIITQNLSAVTAACLMMRREVFEKLGGLDERYAVAFNDVELCARIRQAGYLIVWTPFAELYHHESVTRGADDTPEKLARFVREVRMFAIEWSELLTTGDPYYNPNLTLQRPDFSPRLLPEGPWRLADFLRSTVKGAERSAGRPAA